MTNNSFIKEQVVRYILYWDGLLRVAWENYLSCPFSTVPGDDKKPLAFKKFPKSQTVVEGKAASFPVKFDKEPLKVSWLKDGKPVDESSPRFKFEQEGKKEFTLEIPNCLPTDVGQYLVKATSKKGEVTAAFSLNVHSSEEL